MSEAKRNVIVSCYNDRAAAGGTPVGFVWVNDLLSHGLVTNYRLTIVLHGACLKYGLNEQAYRRAFQTPNPFLGLLHGFAHDCGVAIKVCGLCLEQDGYAASDLAPFVKPVAFSIQYLIEQQLRHGALVIYDSQPASSAPAAALTTATCSRPAIQDAAGRPTAQPVARQRRRQKRISSSSSSSG